MGIASGISNFFRGIVEFVVGVFAAVLHAVQFVLNTVVDVCRAVLAGLVNSVLSLSQFALDFLSLLWQHIYIVVATGVALFAAFVVYRGRQRQGAGTPASVRQPVPRKQQH